MDAEIKQKWVEALRSGEYEQGKGKLRNIKNEYCCLGVLCAVQGAEFKLLPGCHYILVHRDNSFGFPPKDFFAGCTDKQLVTLYEMNDGANGRQFSFKEIANYIEKTL